MRSESPELPLEVLDHSPELPDLFLERGRRLGAEHRPDPVAGLLKVALADVTTLLVPAFV